MEKTFFAYHVVTERPMHLGQHIIYTSNEPGGCHDDCEKLANPVSYSFEQYHNGVYQRVMDQLNMVDAIYQNPEAFRNEDLEYPVVVALRELALEEVRKEKYCHYPSRMACLYVSETLQEAGQWADYFMNLNRPTFQIVKLRISGNKFVGDATKCFYATVHKEDNLKLAEKYWKNEENHEGNPPIKEILVDGDIEVVEIVKVFE